MGKVFKLFLALTLASAMCLAGFSAASAGTLNGDNALINGDGTDPIKAAVTKILQMPIGTGIPNATFTFTVKPVSVDGNASQTSIMPELGANNKITINFASGTTALTPATAGGDDAYYKESGDIFAQIDETSFPHAGIYIYEITENPDTNTAIDEDPNQELTYSKAKYILTVYVADNDDYTGTYIYALGTVRNTKDDNTSAADTKVDPTPGADNSSESGYSQMSFRNTYVHTNGPVDPTNTLTPPVDPTDPGNATLTVNNTVTGSLGNSQEYFDYSMTIDPPTLQKNVPDAYRAYVVESVDGVDTVVTSEDNGTVAGTDEYGPYLEFTPGEPTDFQLKHGQRLVFVNTAVGSSYSVTESASDHEPSVGVTTGGVDTSPAIDSAGAGGSISSGAQFVGEPTNVVDFTNNRNVITPTGLSMNDMPFFGLIALAVGALAAFIAVKSRRKRGYNQ